MQTLNLLLGCILICTAVVEGQGPPPRLRPRGPSRGRPGPLKKTCTLNYTNDIYSMFYWKGYENICTKSLCDEYRWLKCDVAREYILDQALGHGPEDILMEIEYIKKYFNTLIPQPKNILEYSCEGVCQENARSLQLERLFADIPTMNQKTYSMEKRRLMCIVIGPDIYYQRCGGKCKMLYGGRGDSYCVPDVFVTIDIWVFCPEAKPDKCHKIKFDLPLSCSCKKFRCRKDLPANWNNRGPPLLPEMPTDWDPRNPGYPADPTFFTPINPNPSLIGPHHDPTFKDVAHGPVPLGPVQLGPGQGGIGHFNGGK